MFPPPKHSEIWRGEILAGLNKPRPEISTKFLYSPEGIDLFNKTSKLPNFWPNEIERRTLKNIEYRKDIQSIIFVGCGKPNVEIPVCLATLSQSLQKIWLIDVSQDSIDKSIQAFRNNEVLKKIPISQTLSDIVKLKYLGESYQSSLCLLTGGTLMNLLGYELKALNELLLKSSTKGELIFTSNAKKFEEFDKSRFRDSPEFKIFRESSISTLEKYFNIHFQMEDIISGTDYDAKEHRYYSWVSSTKDFSFNDQETEFSRTFCSREKVIVGMTRAYPSATTLKKISAAGFSKVESVLISKDTDFCVSRLTW